MRQRFKGFKQRLEELRLTLLKPINPAVIVVLGVYTLFWGVWIMLPFPVFTHAMAFELMSQYGTELLWGGIAISAGLIIVRGALKPVYWNIEIGALVAFFFWLIIGILFFIGDWQNPAWISSACFSLYSALIWLNIEVNRKYYGNNDY